jgi:branched chain amino acid efflux pump
MWVAIAIGAASCYALKLGGLSLPKAVLENRRVQKVTELLPVALLAALIVTQTFSKQQELTVDPRAAGVAVAVIAVLRRAPFLAVVTLAAVTAALLRLIA